MKSTYDKLTQVKARLQEIKTPASIEELAAYMDCNTRTVYRYLSRLEAENCGLKRTKTSPYAFFIQAPAPKRPEAIIRGLKSAQKVLEKMGTTVHGKSVKKAIDFLNGNDSAEIESMNPGLNVDNDFIVDLGPFSEYSENLEFRESEVDKFLDAIKTRSKLALVYKAGHSAQEQNMEVCPLKLVLRIDTLYLIVQESGKIKLLAVKRIKNFRKTGAFFPEIEFDYKSLYRNCFGKFSAADSGAYQKIKLVMTVEESWLQMQFGEAHFNPPVKIKRQNPMVVELSVYDTPDLESWLLGILPFVKIQEPASIKAKLKDLLKKSSAAL